jgi:hypothetical protein
MASGMGTTDSVHNPENLSALEDPPEYHPNAHLPGIDQLANITAVSHRADILMMGRVDILMMDRMDILTMDRVDMAMVGTKRHVLLTAFARLCVFSGIILQGCDVVFSDFDCQFYYFGFQNFI